MSLIPTTNEDQQREIDNAPTQVRSHIASCHNMINSLHNHAEAERDKIGLMRRQNRYLRACLAQLEWCGTRIDNAVVNDTMMVTEHRSCLFCGAIKGEEHMDGCPLPWVKSNAEEPPTDETALLKQRLQYWFTKFCYTAPEQLDERLQDMKDDLVALKVLAPKGGEA
jgi:hypothetical protein